jgi:hypothetical protein
MNIEKYKQFKNFFLARYWRLTPMFLVTQEAEIRWITVQTSLGK